MWRDFARLADTVSTSCELEEWKHVLCEECRTVYFVHVSVFVAGEVFIGGDSSEDIVRADRAATAAARNKLKHAIEPVPCPKCGRVQSAMVKAARLQRYRWRIASGSFLALAAVPGYVVALFVGRDATVAVGVALTLLVLGTIITVAFRVLRSRYDPNAAIPAAERIALGQRLAMSPKHHAAMMAKKYPQAPPVHEP